jgi:lambda repressor-like predicted transcriptional regulator
VTATFPAAPALRLLTARAEDDRVSLTELAQRIRLPRRTLHRVLASSRLRWDTADRVAVALGRHPFEIWPSWFDEAVQA